MSETKTLSAGATLARLLKGTVQQTEKSINSCPENKRFYQLGDKKATPLWLLGHMANTSEFIGNIVGLGSPSGAIQPEWRIKFTPEMFGGSPITTNPADYPSWDEVHAAYTKSMNQLIEGAAKLSDEELIADPKGKLPDRLRALVTTLQDCLTLNIVHDSHHRGQLAMLANAPE